jgi:hypothetical protein
MKCENLNMIDLGLRPIGTTSIAVAPNKYARNCDQAFIATHYERIRKGVRPRSFYGDTETSAKTKAEEYDALRQAKFEAWNNSARERKVTSIERRDTELKDLLVRVEANLKDLPIGAAINYDIAQGIILLNDELSCQEIT